MQMLFSILQSTCVGEQTNLFGCQIEKMLTDDKELGSTGGIILTKGHQYWFLERPKWLISAWAAAHVEVIEDCKIQNEMMQTFWERQKEMMLTQLGV